MNGPDRPPIHIYLSAEFDSIECRVYEISDIKSLGPHEMIPNQSEPGSHDGFAPFPFAIHHPPNTVSVHPTDRGYLILIWKNIGIALHDKDVIELPLDPL